MNKNPNPFQNATDNKMTESVKLAYLQGGSDHEGRSAEQFLKYANNKGEPFEGFDEKQANQNIGIELGNNARQIRTQYSQISHVQTGFKKLKGNQVEILKELRNEYDMLRNLPAHEQKKQKPKSISSSSNHRRSNRQQSSQTSSISSSKKYANEKESNRDNVSGLNNREERVWIVQRKQYEMIVSNCQQKIEELLHSELEYKKTIHNLRSALAAETKIPTPVDNSHLESEITNLKSKLTSEESKCRNLEKQFEKAKNQNKILQEKIISYEGMIIGKDHDASKYQDQMRRYEDTLRLQREKYHNIQIEKVKMIMEYEILEKEKTQQIMRLNNVIEQNNRHFEENKRLAIQRLEDLVELKDQRYRLLLAEYERLKRQSPQKPEIEQIQDNSPNQLDTFVRILQEYISEKNKVHSNDIERLILAIKELRSREDDIPIIPGREDDQYDKIRLLLEIRTLKEEIDKLKEMQGENVEKYRQEIARGFQAEIYGLKQNIRTLELKLRQKSEFTPTINPYQPINTEVFNLRRQINNLQNTLREKDSLLKQLDENWKKYKVKWQRSEQQLRNTKNQLDSALFENQKLLKQLDFRINILKRENEAAIRSISSEVEIERRNVAHWKNEFENVKRFYEIKITQKNRLIEKLENSAEICQIREEYNISLESAKQEYERQIAALAEKLSLLANNEKQLQDFRRRYNNLEAAMFDMKLSYEKNRQLNSGIDHLWSMKEIQYGNVNAIVGQIKQNFRVGPPINRNPSKNNLEAGIVDGFGGLFTNNASNQYGNQGNQGWSNATGPSNLNQTGANRNSTQINAGITDGFANLFTTGQDQQQLDSPYKNRISGSGMNRISSGEYNNDGFGRASYKNSGSNDLSGSGAQFGMNRASSNNFRSSGANLLPPPPPPLLPPPPMF